MEVPEVQIETLESENGIAPESLDRALALLARWACRRGQNLGKCPLVQGQNLLTATDAKTYGAQDADN